MVNRSLMTSLSSILESPHIGVSEIEACSKLFTDADKLTSINKLVILFDIDSSITEVQFIKAKVQEHIDQCLHLFAISLQASLEKSVKVKLTEMLYKLHEIKSHAFKKLEEFEKQQLMKQTTLCKLDSSTMSGA